MRPSPVRTAAVALILLASAIVIIPSLPSQAAEDKDETPNKVVSITATTQFQHKIQGRWQLRGGQRNEALQLNPDSTFVWSINSPSGFSTLQGEWDYRGRTLLLVESTAGIVLNVRSLTIDVVTRHYLVATYEKKKYYFERKFRGE